MLGNKYVYNNEIKIPKLPTLKRLGEFDGHNHNNKNSPNSIISDTNSNSIRQIIIEMKEKPLFLDKKNLLLPDEENGLYKSNQINDSNYNFETKNNDKNMSHRTGLLLGQGIKTQTTLKDVYKSHQK